MFGDFSYQQTTRITGGAAAAAMRVAGAFSSKAREPMSSTVIVAGHRMAHLSPGTATIIDLDKETITTIDYGKKSFSTMTFDEMRRTMQDAAARMPAEEQNDASKADVHYKASVRETGQSKLISGMNTREVILTLTMEGKDKQTGDQGALNVISDMWLAPDVPGYQEVREFHKLMATKLGWAPGQSFGAMMGRSDMAKATQDLAAEMSKLDGVPVLQVTSITGSGTPGAAGEGAPAAPPPSSDSGSPGTAADALSRLGRIGGFGGFGRKKNPDAGSVPPPPNSTNNTSAGAPGALIEMTIESTGFSAAPVDPSKLEVPAGFQQVDPQSNRRGRR